MVKKRVVKKYGNSNLVKLETADMKDYQIEENDELDMEDAFNKHLKKKEGKKNGS